MTGVEWFLPLREARKTEHAVGIIHSTPLVMRLQGETAKQADFVGTFAFALSCAIAAVKRELDFFGVLVLSFVAATIRGIIRDVLIGAIPPASDQYLRFRTT